LNNTDSAIEWNNTYSAIEITDHGAISEVTQGSALDYPYYELGVPPYDHYCPVCE
jgi:hypothetical protein